MKSAMGLLVVVVGGLLIYDGFAGRSLWGDFLTVIRGQGVQGKGSGQSNTFSNPQADSSPAPFGSDKQSGDTGQAPATNPIPPTGPQTTNPIGRIRAI